MKKVYVKLTCDASGDASVTSPSWVFGMLYAISYLPGTIATGATVTVTCEGPLSKPLLTKANAGTSNAVFYPRDLLNGVADGAALTGTAGGDRGLPIMDGKVKVVVAAGGNAGAGGLIVYYED